MTQESSHCKYIRNQYKSKVNQFKTDRAAIEGRYNYMAGIKYGDVHVGMTFKYLPFICIGVFAVCMMIGFLGVPFLGAILAAIGFAVVLSVYFKYKKDSIQDEANSNITKRTTNLDAIEAELYKQADAYADLAVKRHKEICDEYTKVYVSSPTTLIFASAIYEKLRYIVSSQVCGFGVDLHEVTYPGGKITFESKGLKNLPTYEATIGFANACAQFILVQLRTDNPNERFEMETEDEHIFYRSYKLQKNLKDIY